MLNINRIIFKILLLVSCLLFNYVMASTTVNVDESRILKPYVTDDAQDNNTNQSITSGATTSTEPAKLQTNDNATNDNALNKSDVSIKDSVNIESTESKNNALDTKEVPVFEHPSKVINKDLFDYLEKSPTNIELAGLANKMHNIKLIKSLYVQKDMNLLWIKDDKLTDLGYQLIKAISKSGEDALPPELYHYSSFSSLKANQQVAEPIQLDVLLTDAFVAYKSHLRNGIVNPKKQFPTWTLKPRSIDFAQEYDIAAKDGNFAKVLTVDNQDYNILKKAYNNLINQPIDKVEFKRITATKLVLGNQGADVAILREKLGASKGSVFDDELKKKVIAYQIANHLKGDGVVGLNTIELLNTSTQDFVDLLKINMERMRWVYVPQNINYIWVNIPAFKMAVRNEGEFIFESNVIVGTKKRQTPIFSNTLEYVVLNPYWNVPKTIFQEDKLPKLKANPQSLGTEMQVVNARTGEVVNSSDVDWDNGGAGYRLRELPGDFNSLGKVKFLFPNKYDIYLHDTPQRGLFKRETRTFSSGCIRVERAHDLTYFLLEKMNWDDKKITTENSKATEKWVPLSKSLNYPVFINYYTVWVASDKTIKQSRDIYGYDDKMLDLYSKTINKYNK